LKFLFTDYRPLFPEPVTAEEQFCVPLGRELTPEEKRYLSLAEIALGPLSRDFPTERRSNVTPMLLKRGRHAA
jgi:hypothetical protein